MKGRKDWQETARVRARVHNHGAYPEFSQTEAPLWQELRRYAENPLISFHTPGHKRGQSLGDGWNEPGVLTGIDLTEIASLRWAESWAEAESLAARFYKADQTFFLVQGATQGIIASLLGAFSPGDTVLVSRNCHVSVLHGMIMADLQPVFIENQFLSGWRIPVGISNASLQARLREHPEAKGLLVTNPTYQGIAQPVAQYREMIGNERILIVDEAHGGHFGWMGYDGYDASAHADLWVHGTHKTLGSLTQTGMLHLAGGRVQPARIRRALQLITTTSPSYVLLASLDSNRRFLADAGHQMFQRIGPLRKLRERFASLHGLQFIESPPGAAWVVDPWRLCLSFRCFGVPGLEAEAGYRGEFGIQPEYADLEQVTFFISPWQDPTCLERLSEATASLLRQYAARPGLRRRTTLAMPRTLPRLVRNPRTAALGPTREIPLDQAVGQIAAAVVAPYPPGVPLLAPGEVIRDEDVRLIRRFLGNGGEVRGIRDEMIVISVGDSR